MQYMILRIKFLMYGRALQLALVRVARLSQLPPTVRGTFVCARAASSSDASSSSSISCRELQSLVHMCFPALSACWSKTSRRQQEKAEAACSR